MANNDYHVRFPGPETKVLNLGEHQADTARMLNMPRLFGYPQVRVDPNKIQPDATEALAGYALLPVAELRPMIAHGDVGDGFTIAAVSRAEQIGIFKDRLWQEPSN